MSFLRSHMWVACSGDHKLPAVTTFRLNYKKHAVFLNKLGWTPVVCSALYSWVLPLWVVCFVGNKDPFTQEWAGVCVSGKFSGGVPLHAEAVSSLRSNVAKPLYLNWMCASMKRLQTNCWQLTEQFSSMGKMHLHSHARTSSIFVLHVCSAGVQVSVQSFTSAGT